MSFRYAEAFWLLLLVPVAVAALVYAFRARRSADAKVGGASLTGQLIQGRAPRLRATRGVLLVVGLVLMVCAWAGPQYGSHTRMLTKRGIDVVVALDFSKSMLAQDVSPNRIDRAKAELSRMLTELAGDRVGLVAFAGDTMEFPMTTDYAAVRLFLRDLGPYDMPVGGTAIGRALVAARRLLLRSSEEPDGSDDPRQARSRVVILVTDGEDHEGDPAKAAQELAELGIVLHVVGIGSASGEPIPTFAPDGTRTGYIRDDDGEVVLSAMTPENARALSELASTAGGQFFQAKRGSAGIDEIRRLMRGMKQQEHEARRVRIAEDRYTLVLLLAFLCLLAEALLPDSARALLPRRST